MGEELGGEGKDSSIGNITSLVSDVVKNESQSGQGQRTVYICNHYHVASETSGVDSAVLIFNDA